MAKIELYVAIEINDDAAAMLDASAMGGAAGTAITIVRNSLVNVAGFRKVTVDTAEVADDTEDDGDETEDAPADRDTPKGRTGLSDRQVAHAYRQGIPFSAPKGGPSGRTGRPATLHNLRAADGEPVRASGPRSRENLEAAGIAVWDAEAGETGPVVKAKNTGERAKVARVGAPVMKARR